MLKVIVVASIALASLAFAEGEAPWQETKPAPAEQPPKEGVEKTENGFYPKTESHDGKWTLVGFTIVDNSSGKVVFEWTDRIEAVMRKYMHVSWSPDSNRIVADGVLVDGRWVDFLSNCVGLRTSKSTVRHCRMTNPNGQQRPC